MTELISKSVEMAIDLVCKYISRVHFFLTDCENKNTGSIFKFGFRHGNEFEKFKKDYEGSRIVLKYIPLI